MIQKLDGRDPADERFGALEGRIEHCCDLTKTAGRCTTHDEHGSRVPRCEQGEIPVAGDEHKGPVTGGVGTSQDDVRLLPTFCLEQYDVVVVRDVRPGHAIQRPSMPGRSE